MKNQVITIKADGTIEGLQRKPGQGLDLKAFGKDNLGKAEIERVSEIVWDSGVQAWTVHFLATHTIIDGSKLTYRMWQVLLGDQEIIGARSDAGELDRPVLFDEYDDGVTAEVTYLDRLRLEGKM